MYHGAGRDALTNRRERIGLGGEHRGERAARALAHCHHNLTLARLVLGKSAINSVGCQIFGSPSFLVLGPLVGPDYLVRGSRHCLY
jgi:hypothetical protein